MHSSKKNMTSSSCTTRIATNHRICMSKRANSATGAKQLR